MTSSGCACTGPANALSTIGRASALTGGPSPEVTFSQLLQTFAGVDDLGSRVIRASGNRDNFLVILAGLVLVSRLFCRCRGADIGAQPVRLLLKRRLEGGERFRGPAAFKQHGTVEFAGRLGHAGCDRMLLRPVLGIGGRAHRLQGVITPVLGVKNPGGRDLLLDVDLFRPIAVLCVTKLVPQLNKPGNVDLRGLRIAGTGRTKRTREISDRLHVRERAGTDLKLGCGLPVAALDR